MTKQITIKEDGVSKSESVDFINTQVAGGSANWMPDDETQTGVFYVHANGEYVPSEYGLYGFYAVGVMVPGGNSAETIQPGSLTPTYVTPLPATGLGASVIGVDPTDGAMYRTEIQDVDGVPTLVKTKVADSKQDYKPTSMKILIKPAKLSYKVGEKINYAGLVVQLLDSTGYTFVDDMFPQGIISWSPVKNLLHPEYDLITPVEYAGAGTPHAKYADKTFIFRDGTKLVNSSGPKNSTRVKNVEEYNVKSGEGPFYVIGLIYKGDVGGVICSPSQFVVTRDDYKIVDNVRETSNPYDVRATSCTKYGKTAYYAGRLSFGQSWDGQTDALKNDISSYRTLADGIYDAVISVCHGERVYGDIIPVQWKSPYDNQTYEDKFKIEVSDTESPSSGSDSSGGSSSGGGGGHSF